MVAATPLCVCASPPASVSGYDAFYARGYGGQYLLVIPKLDLVVFCTSDWQRPEYYEHFALVEQFIIPAIASKQR